MFKEGKTVPLSHRVFEDTSYDEIPGIGIPGMLFNIVSCYGFFQEDTSSVILK